ncbi:MAG TPA: hypothetical protein VIJ38_16365 [Acidobacteriaceae bacterium]
MKTIKGPAIFLAQFAGDAAPYNDLASISKWAAELGYKGVQIPTWDARLFDLELAAESQASCDQVLGVLAENGLARTELSTQLQGQLIAVHPAYDLLFDSFASKAVHGNAGARQAWAVEQLGFAAKASKNLGLKAHATFSGALAWPDMYPWPQRPAGWCSQLLPSWRSVGGRSSMPSTEMTLISATKISICKFLIRLKNTSACRVSRPALLLAPLLCTVPHVLRAQATSAPASSNPSAPEWAQPGTATHTQVAPPPGFHSATRTSDTPIGIFQGQSDVGGSLLPGSASFGPGTGQYTITSAGYNVWYTRDEFRYLWKKMSGDISLAADITYPDPNGYGDRKAVLVIRQSLDDDSKEALVALHGGGMIHLAQRPENDARMKDMEYRIGGRGLPGGESPDSLVPVIAKRIGIQKKGDSFTLFVSVDGEPMHQFGAPIQLHLEGPFYVGIGFCSHLPDKTDTAVLSNVVLENAAGKVR